VGLPVDVLARALKPLPTPNTFIDQSATSGQAGADILQVLPWGRVATGARPGESEAGLAGRLRQLTGVNATIDRNLPRLLDQLGPAGFGPMGTGPSLTPVVLMARRDDGGMSIQNFYRPFAMQDTTTAPPGQPQATASAGLQLLGPGMSVYVTAHPDGLAASLKTARIVSRQSPSDGQPTMLRFSSEGSLAAGGSLQVSEAGGATMRLPPGLSSRLLAFLSRTG
jgi:hypothetical protein